MKVVLFCGGFGLRLSSAATNTPKPLVCVGQRPIMWHLMKYYAHYGHREFVLCLGYRGDAIKQYFLDYQEALSNDFVMTEGGRNITLLNRDIEDWTIHFVDTGQRANVGERLLSVRSYLGDEEYFMANYADGLSDLALDEYVEWFKGTGKIGCFISVQPTSVFHMVREDDEGNVRSIEALRDSDVRINGGFFIFRREVFDYIQPGEDLVEGPLQRLMAEKQLVARRFDGFWRCMDTFKDRQGLEELVEDDPPWQVWQRDDP